MKDKWSAFYVKFRNLMWREEGQDMIEYTLLIFLAALAVAVGMKVLGTEIDAAFTNIAAMTSTYSGRSSGSPSATSPSGSSSGDSNGNRHGHSHH